MTLPSTPRSPSGSLQSLDRLEEELALPGRGVASCYAASLLESLGWPVRRDSSDPADPSPARSWANSGAMALTGPADEPPLLAPGPVASCMDGAARALRALARATTGRAPSALDGPALLGERAALASPAFARAGRRSVGGSCRLVRCSDEWLALNLARPEDEALLPAWLEATPDSAPWAFVERTCRQRQRDALVARGRLLGMAVSPAAQVATMTPAPDWQHTLDYSTRFGAGRPQATRSPLVVDLSSLWAGPLCGQLLAACGARVVKIESLERPDGARRGDRSFFDLMNAEKESVALPFREGRGRDALAALLARADLVIEASRPRALEQLGIDATEFASRHGTTWVSITGHGRTPPGSEWVAFGDDAAASAGLVAASPANSSPCFCGDAIADPITGLHAAVAGLSAWAKGGARLVDISLQGVAAHVRHFPTPEAPAEAAGLVRPPRARPSQGRAPALGTDTRRVLTELGISC